LVLTRTSRPDRLVVGSCWQGHLEWADMRRRRAATKRFASAMTALASASSVMPEKSMRAMARPW
jgi:hypothetical protein